MMQANGTRDATGARQATSDSTGMNASAAEGSARPRGKLGAVLEALEAGTGASLAALTGWQPQTVRAALSKLRRRGFAVRVAQPSDTAPSRRVGVSRFFVRLEIRPSSDFRADTAQPAAPTQQLTFVETNRIVGVIAYFGESAQAFRVLPHFRCTRMTSEVAMTTFREHSRP